MNPARTYRQMYREIERMDAEMARLEVALKRERRRTSTVIRPRPDPVIVRLWATMNREIRDVLLSVVCFVVAVAAGAAPMSAAPWIAGAYGLIGSLVLTYAIIGRRADQTKGH